MSRPSRKAAAASPPANTAAQERSSANNRNRHMRLRVAWMYFIEEMTQQEIAEHLGIGRVTVVRLLSDARARNEVQFKIVRADSERVDLERALERRFGLTQALVLPVSHPDADATLPISAATGAWLSEHVRPGLKIGVGWGRTLLESLQYIEETSVPDMSVVSLLGGVTRVRHFNPVEFASRLSRCFQAECYLMTAPAIVDSPETRRTLIERCGLAEMFTLAESLDTILVSVGTLDAAGTAYRDGFVSDEVRRSMIARGAVGESLFNFFDAEGRLIDHPIQGCVMNVPLSTLQRVPQRVLASGGLPKAAALLGAIRLLRPTVLITDEHVAARVLELAGSAS